MASSAQPRADVTIISAGHNVADARLHREVAALRRAGLQVAVIGMGNAADGPVGAQVRTWPARGKIVRGLRALYFPWVAQSPVLLSLDPDVAVGLRLRKLLNPAVRTVTDIHEDYRALLKDRSWARGLLGAGARLLAKVATSAYRGADLAVVADKHLELGVPDRLLLRNLPDSSLISPTAAQESTLRAIYIGDIRPSRGLFTMLDGVRDSTDWVLDLVGPMNGDTEAKFNQYLADNPGLDERVTWHGRMPPKDAWSLVPTAALGLLLLEDTPAFREAMPSKLYEYRASGVPVVSTDLPQPAKLVRDSQTGIVLAVGQPLAEVLDQLAANPAELAQLRARALKVGKQYLGDAELDRFAAAVLALRGGATQTST